MRLAVLLLVLVSSACGPAGTLSRVESDVFAKSCAQTSCHKGSSPAGGLSLEGKTHARLVGGATTMQGAVMVTAGKPESSLLMQRLTAAPPLTMPPGEALDAARLELVRSWIAAGAKDD